MVFEQYGRAQGWDLGGCFKYGATCRTLALLLMLALSWASAALAMPEKPAGLDDADWASLQRAFNKAAGQQSKLAAGSRSGADGAADDYFGGSVALDGDTALVGAYRDDVGSNRNQGSVYVFARSGSTWTLQAKLTAADGAADDYFGSALALDGDTALVGANQDDVGARSNQGSAYVFTRSGAIWTQQTKLTAADGAVDRYFGTSVALDGDTALVGAYFDNVGTNGAQGSAYVFTRSGATWLQQAKLMAADGGSADIFGVSVALDGDTALIGASNDDVGANADQGSAYVFTRSGTAWAEEAKLTAADGGPNDQFGYSVALDGDTALVGASQDMVRGIPFVGSAYVFTRSGTAWTQQAQLAAADGAEGDRFGVSVALDGDTALVGADLDDAGANRNQGSAYVFTRTGANWAQQVKFTAVDGAAEDAFGHSVALDGNTLLVAAHLDDVGVSTDQGSLDVFIRAGASWTQQVRLTAGDGATDSFFGTSVALHGATALVGAFGDDGNSARQGAAYVFILSGGTWVFQEKLTATDGALDDSFGFSVALEGNTALVGSPRDGMGGNGEQGSVYVFTRDGAIWTQQAKLNAADGTAGDYFGYSVALDGDTALVGASYDDVDGSRNQGSAYVFTRNGSAWTQQARLTAADGAPDDLSGFSVALDGDTALVGVPGDDVGSTSNQGSTYVFIRSGTIWTQQARLTATNGALADRFGESVALDGDTALVGASYHNADGIRDLGAAYVFTRGGATWTQQAQLKGGSRDGRFGYSVALDGDSALVGAALSFEGINASQGSAFFFQRSSATWANQATLTAADGAASDFFGVSVALDGGTALVGASGDDGPVPFGNPSEGAAYVFPVLGGQAQTIDFANPGPQTFGTTPTLRATASSGLDVVLSSATSGVCTITTAGTLGFVAEGVCTIHADQAGNATFLAAPRVSHTFVVNAVVPGAPTIGIATAGDGQAAVSFSAPASNGGGVIASYRVTSSPGGFTAIGGGSPITVSGLTNGTIYTFTVQATNSAGLGAASAPSNLVIPSAAIAGPVLRPDRANVRDNGGEVRIDVLANDSIAPALLGIGTLSIIDAPLRGTASVLSLGPVGLPGDVIAYMPTGAASGTDTLRYRVCFGGATPCVESSLSIEIRPLDAVGIVFAANGDRGHRDLALSGLRTLPAARFDAHGLVAPVVVSPSLTVDATPETPFDAGGAETTLRTFAASTSARAWRVFVDARSLSGGDVDVYLGLDANNNGQADSGEVACAAAMSSVGERCELVVNQSANLSARYWVRLHSRSGAQTARAELFEVPVDRPVAQRQLVATGPGGVAANAEFPMRLIWNDPTLVPGQVRGGWLEVRSDANTSLGWVPIRIERGAGAAVPFALQSGIDHAMALAASAANEGLYIDVPPGTTRLDATTNSATNVDLHLARIDTPAASSATPTVPNAPARNLATASAVTPSGNESLTVNNPAAGRWYVTPVNATGGTADLTVRATLTGTGPVLRPGGFYNPQRSGNGLFLYPAGSEWAGLWYTYLQDGTPTWYYLQAPAPGATGIWRGTIYRSAWNGSSNFLTPVGEATVTPRSTSAFTFSYTLDGETGSEAYENFGGGCPTFAGAPLNASGHWFDPARAGSGYSVQLFPNYEFYTVFGYDAQGVPRYLIAERSGIGTATQSMNLDQNTGACPLCTRTGNPVRSTVGTLTRTVGSGTLQRIQLTGNYTAGVAGTWTANDAVTPLGTLQGCAGN
jgi:hypothetical protein